MTDQVVTKHHCLICDEIAICLDEVEGHEGTCDYRNMYLAHGYCLAQLPKEDQAVYLKLVEQLRVVIPILKKY